MSKLFSSPQWNFCRNTLIFSLDSLRRFYKLLMHLWRYNTDLMTLHWKKLDELGYQFSKMSTFSWASTLPHSFFCKRTQIHKNSFRIFINFQFQTKILPFFSFVTLKFLKFWAAYPHLQNYQIAQLATKASYISEWISLRNFAIIQHSKTRYSWNVLRISLNILRISH